MNTKPPRKRHRWLRVILWIVVVLLLLPVFLVLLFQLAPVQNFAKNKVEGYLRNKFHTTVLIGGLRLNWWNSLALDKVYLGDKADQPLLYSGSLNVSFNLLALRHNELVIKKLHWEDVLINVYRKPGDSTYNYQFIIDAFASPEKKDTINKSGTTMTYSIGNVELDKIRLHYNDMPKRMDAMARWGHLLLRPGTLQPDSMRYVVKQIKLDSALLAYSDSANNKWGIRNFNLDADDIKYSADSILANVHTLTLQEEKGFAIREFHGDVLYSSKEIALRNLLLQTNKSRLASEVIAKVPSWTTIKDSLSQLQVNAVLENTHLDLTELKQLLPDLQKNKSIKFLLRKIVDANGKITGSMQRLQVDELNLADNDGSKLYVTGVVHNATDYNHLLAEVKEINLQSGARSVKSWLPAGTIPDSIAIPAQIHLLGSGKYSKNAILADLKLNSSDGDIIINGNTANYTDVINSRYDVRIPLLRVNAGKLLKDTTMGLINISLSAKGSGYDYKRLTANIDLLIKEAVYKRYHYKNINSKAALTRGDFNVFLDSRDPNVLTKLQLKGAIDSLKRNVSGYVNIDKLDLYTTHWTTSPLATKGNIVLDVPGMQPRHLKGDILLTGFELADDSTLYGLDTLKVLASDTLNQQQLNVSGPFGFIAANGDYDYTKAFGDMAAMIQQHLQADSNRMLVEKQTQIMDLNASLQWPKSLQHLVPSLVMKEPLTLNAHLNTDSSLLKAGFLLPSLGFNEFKFDTLHGTINSDAAQMVANIYLAGLSHPQFPLDKTMLDVTAKNGTLDADLTMLDKGEKKKYALGTIVKFLPNNGLSLSLKPDLLLNKQPWTVSDKNEIRLENGALRSADLTISSRGQSIGVKTVSEKTNATPDLEVNINQFRLSTVTAILGKDSLFADGLAGGKVTISNYDKSPLVNAKLAVDSITMMNTRVGSLNIDANTPQANVYNVKAQLTGNDNDVQVQGTYAKQLDFNVNLSKLNMKSIEPFTMGAVSRLRGVTSGQLTIKGDPSAPQLRGRLEFDSVGAAITATGTYLRIPEDELIIDEQGIKFDGFTITDSLNHEVMIDGQVLTKDFKDYRFRLDVDADDFMAIGPKQSPDQMLYGPTSIDATARIRGDLNEPRVDVTLKLRDSSSFTLVVPENNPGVADREGVIVFVDKHSQLDSSLLHITKDTAMIKKPAIAQGMVLNAKVEITPNSLLKVIVDQDNGDYLEIKGTANLVASMAPNSDLSITGRYEINEGRYNMSLNNLIKRNFTIEKGSSITFEGGIKDALADITARYRVMASAGDLVQDQLAGASETRRTQFKQKEPVDVYLQIKNQLMKPQISFRLDMPEKNRNDLNGVLYTRIKQINQVESELNKQVMGLLVLNSFIPDNPLDLANEGGASGIQGTARRSASKLISQQLNNFAGSLIKGFDVNFDLQSQDDYTTGKLQNSTNLNIGVSKSLFNDRVSVSVGSSVNIEGPQQTQQPSTLVGDVSVDYKITPDGKYRVRAYRQNDTDEIVEGEIIETGASFIFVIDYNEFRDLFHKKKEIEKVKKKKREKKK